VIVLTFADMFWLLISEKDSSKQVRFDRAIPFIYRLLYIK
jgi:hypothetical protein